MLESSRIEARDRPARPPDPESFSLAMAPPQEQDDVGEDRRLGPNLVRTVIPVTQVGIGNRGAFVAWA